ncbi:MAG: Pycsar system effector family protein [Dokdonella sp.]
MADESTKLAAVEDEKRVATAWNQLNLVLSFFTRIDTKLSVVLGLDLGMLAVLFTRIPRVKEVTTLQWVFAVPFFVAIGTSLFHLYRGSFPHLLGGTTSLVFFRRIGAMQESEFLRACRTRSSTELAEDLFEQVWRNSKILTIKFESLQRAHHALILASIPWLGALGLLATF